MPYPLLLVIHLFAAIMFVGTVFFEVLMLEGVRKHVPKEAMRSVEGAIGQRARAVMPWVLLLLFGAGFGLAWFHRAALATPMTSHFGLLLFIKIMLALSVFGHFLTAMALHSLGRLRSRASQRIHISVFIHVVLIVLLAKIMFYAG
ncbi:MAG TPA: hypothetical protein VKZ70_08850 [Burkholderiaceae bacterium]|nr:hypothetical protein [Burkholderiaceae bacterium]